MSERPPDKPDPSEQIEKALADWRKQITDREGAVDELRQKLADARLKYDLAKASFDRAARVASDVGLNNPDGAHGILVATRNYNEALRRYRGMLQAFTDFVFENSPGKRSREISDNR